MRLNQSKKALATFLLAIITASCTPGNTPPRQGFFVNTTLPPCSGDGTIFSLIPFNFWAYAYHQLVDAAVTAHLKSFNNQGSDSPFFSNLQCAAPDLSGLLQPSAPLFLIATQLPPWQDPQNLASLSEQDFGVVLLEFLRIYECALKNHRTFLDVNIMNDAPLFSKLPLQWPEFGVERKRRESVIEQELRIARSALDRILSTSGALDRLRPFLLDLECIERASLDLRNVLGLISEGSTCLPRVWDARGSLRDPPPS
ncbi:hypothetical protein HYZ98_05415 [Candidatus Peregrinibacteria bacterium]|nr:hypothetical protein [Candidatus Peregrinibacteria bacterium]